MTTRKFFSAVGDNDLEYVQKYIENRGNVNVKDEIGYTALHIAAENKNFEMCELLLTNGANVNAKNKSGNTALHLAVLNRQLSICDLLIIHKIDVNLEDRGGVTALHMAASNGDLDICKMLIAAGADRNIEDNEGNTALTLAARYKRVDVSDFLSSVSESTSTSERADDGDDIDILPIDKCSLTKNTRKCKYIDEKGTKIGSGAFGAVKAIEVKPGQKIAIKTMSLKSGLVETSVGAVIHHPYVLEIHDVLTYYNCDNQPIDQQSLLMDLAEGSIKGIDSSFANKMINIVEACHFLYMNDILYTDLKQENILIKNGEFILGDLGSCIFLNRRQNTNRKYTHTPNYVVPGDKGIGQYIPCYQIALIYSEIVGKTSVNKSVEKVILETKFDDTKSNIERLRTAHQNVLFHGRNSTGLPQLVGLSWNAYELNDTGESMTSLRLDDYLPEKQVVGTIVYNDPCKQGNFKVKYFLNYIAQSTKLITILTFASVIHNLHCIGRKLQDQFEEDIVLDLIRIDRHFYGTPLDIPDERLGKIIALLNGILRPVTLLNFSTVESVETDLMAFLDDDYFSVFKKATTEREINDYELTLELPKMKLENMKLLMDKLKN